MFNDYMRRLRGGMVVVVLFTYLSLARAETGEIIFENNVRVDGDLVVTGAMAVARQGDVSMGAYTNGMPALGSVEKEYWFESPSGGVYIAGNVDVGTDIQGGDLTVHGEANIKGDLSVEGRVSDSTGIVMPVGSIIAYGGTNPPSGWLLCDGRDYLRSNPVYQDLFAAIGTAYGATNSSYFCIPDLRGMFLRGVSGTGAIETDPDRGDRRNFYGGNTNNAVGSRQDDDFFSHDHPLGGATLLWPVGESGETWSGWSSSWPRVPTASSTAHAGGNETRPRNVYVNYIIKY